MNPCSRCSAKQFCMGEKSNSDKFRNDRLQNVHCKCNLVVCACLHTSYIIPVFYRTLQQLDQNKQVSQQKRALLHMRFIVKIKKLFSFLILFYFIFCMSVGIILWCAQRLDQEWNRNFNVSPYQCLILKA